MVEKNKKEKILTLLEELIEFEINNADERKIETEEIIKRLTNSIDETMIEIEKEIKDNKKKKPNYSSGETFDVMDRY